jgi:hypothetical protein
VQAAAKRVEDGEHLVETDGGLSALQFDQEAQADTSSRSQLILAQALCEAGLPHDGANLVDSH